MTTDEKENALILCGHGSRSQSYLKDFLSLKEKIQRKFKHLEVSHCFIEINQPTIEECLKKLSKQYKRIFFFPLLIFEGKHMIEDIKKNVNNISNLLSNNIILIDKISLVDEVLPITSKIIKEKYSNRFDILITSCSFSKKKEVKKELMIYTKKLSKLISIKKMIFCFVGEEKQILKEINSNKDNRFLLHPIFFFDGYLFEKSIKEIEKSTNSVKLLPISHYKEIINFLTKKLVSAMQTFD